MKTDSKELEYRLLGQQAADLDEELLDRLEAAAEGSLTDLSPEELSFEAELRAIRPQSLSPKLMAGLQARVDGLPAPTQVHVLPFSKRQASPAKQSQQPWLAAAAAVCMLGVITALWLDPMAGPTEVADTPPTPSNLAPPAPATLPPTAPAEFSRALSQTQDQGIIWPENDAPHRVIKVTYTDKVSMKRRDGSTYEVEKPRVEYYLVPTESH